MAPMPIRDAQRMPGLVTGRIVLPGVTVELCVFPEVEPQMLAVTEEETMLSLGLSRLLAGSEGRIASDRRTPFVRFGALGLRLAGIPMEMRVAGGAFHTVRCRFEADVLESRLAPRPLTDAQLAACFDIRVQTIEDAMLRLAAEVEHPGPDSAALTAALVEVILLDLRRYLDDARHRAERNRGGLPPRLVRRVLERIDEPGAAPTIGELAAVCSLSRFHFMRCFRETMGMSPGAFIRQARIARAKALLATDKRPLADLARELGYCGLPAFSAAFRKATGRSPGAYRALLR
ncbi:MAG: AraC family transcriptional regulator [Novosphingobium sp.]|nr:AraC family transcriptional regulator [Novosphingobium sp.]